MVWSIPKAKGFISLLSNNYKIGISKIYRRAASPKCPFLELPLHSELEYYVSSARPFTVCQISLILASPLKYTCSLIFGLHRTPEQPALLDDLNQSNHPNALSKMNFVNSLMMLVQTA